MREILLQLLETAEIVYNSGRSPEELEVLAEIFTGDLAGENRESVIRAFALHRKGSNRFPTPADILRVLPECRIRPDMAEIADDEPPATPEERNFWQEKIRARLRSAKLHRFGNAALALERE